MPHELIMIDEDSAVKPKINAAIAKLLITIVILSHGYLHDNGNQLIWLNMSIT